MCVAKGQTRQVQASYRPCAWPRHTDALPKRPSLHVRRAQRLLRTTCVLGAVFGAAGVPFPKVPPALHLTHLRQFHL